MGQLSRRSARVFQALGYALIAVDVCFMGVHLYMFGTAVTEARHHEEERAEKAEFIFELSFVGLHFVGNLIAVWDLVSGITDYLECNKDNTACALHNVESLSCILYSLFTAYLDSMGVTHAYFGHRPTLYLALTAGLFAESMVSTVYCMTVYFMVRRSRATVLPIGARLGSQLGNGAGTTHQQHMTRTVSNAKQRDFRNFGV